VASCSAQVRTAQAISCWLRSLSTALEHTDCEPEQVRDGLVLARIPELLVRLLEGIVVGDACRRLDHLGD